MGKKIKVAELFAGVGGFRLGLEGWQGRSSASNYEQPADSPYEVVWSNQWEPSTKQQVASEIYEQRFGKVGHANQDIAKVNTDTIPDHDLLVGGFPCQDYSVARTLSQSGGLQGKKGILWWEIHRILKDKLDKGSPVKYLFLENVDRLLKSPVKQRGRDLAVILASLTDLGYAVEWRVINAADYGLPQRRRRVFILGYHNSTAICGNINKTNKEDWLIKTGTFARSFPVVDDTHISNVFDIKGSLADISESFSDPSKALSPFYNAGLIIGRTVTTKKVKPVYEGTRTLVKDILQSTEEVPASFFINEDALDKWNYLKGPKNQVRVNKALGFEYKYAEGGMVFPDPLDQPSRTIITGEGGASPSRFKHVIMQANGKLRRLTPVELERLNMFPADHTKGASDIKRAFLMGNALVVGIVEKVGKELYALVKENEKKTA